MESLHQYQKPLGNPVELALTQVESISSTPDLATTRQEEKALVELDAMCEILGFHQRQYFVESRQAFAIPKSFDRTKNVTYIKFQDGLTFSGKLETFATVKIGRLAIAERNVRALCLAFSTALLMPYLESLDEDELLYAPAQAINDIQPG